MLIVALLGANLILAVANSLAWKRMLNRFMGSNGKSLEFFVAQVSAPERRVHVSAALSIVPCHLYSSLCCCSSSSRR